MRVYVRTSYSTMVRTESNNYGQSWVTKAQDKTEELNVTRSDIVKNIIDASGWRTPSGYSVDETRQTYDDSTYGIVQISPRLGSKKELKYVGPGTWVPNITSTTPIDPFSAKELNALSIKNLLKVRDQKVNISLVVGEMHKSIETITSRATSLYRAYKLARKGRFSQAAKALGITSSNRGRDAAKSWLELKYGWLPMLEDIHGAYEEMTRQTRRTGMRFKVTSRFKRTNAFTPRESMTSFSDGVISFPNAFRVKRVEENELKAQQILWYYVDNPALLTASSVGLTNPMEIIWEVTPWSFAIDWLLPVGDYLAALTADQGLIFLGGCTTVKTESRVTRTANAVGRLPAYNNGEVWFPSTYGGGEWTSRYFSMRRTVHTSSPTPRPPSFKNPFSVGHSMNAVALLRGLK